MSCDFISEIPGYDGNWDLALTRITSLMFPSLDPTSCTKAQWAAAKSKVEALMRFELSKGNPDPMAGSPASLRVTVDPAPVAKGTRP
ncbi:hypothetical protein KIPB_014573, partial [Kipferlia bialata]|eukprot:g14573.t1